MGQNSDRCFPATASNSIGFSCPDVATSKDLHQLCFKSPMLTLITLLFVTRTHGQRTICSTSILRCSSAITGRLGWRLFLASSPTIEWQPVTLATVSVHQVLLGMTRQRESTGCPPLLIKLFITSIPPHESFVEGLLHPICVWLVAVVPPVTPC